MGVLSLANRFSHILPVVLILSTSLMLTSCRGASESGNTSLPPSDANSQNAAQASSVQSAPPTSPTDAQADSFQPSAIDYGALLNQGPSWFLGKLWTCAPHLPVNDPTQSEAFDMLKPMPYSQMANWRFTLDTRDSTMTDFAGDIYPDVYATFSGTTPGATDAQGKTRDTMPAQKILLNPAGLEETGAMPWQPGDEPQLGADGNPDEYFEPFDPKPDVDVVDGSAYLFLGRDYAQAVPYDGIDPQHVYMVLTYATSPGSAMMGGKAMVAAWCQYQ